MQASPIAAARPLQLMTTPRRRLALLGLCVSLLGVVGLTLSAAQALKRLHWGVGLGLILGGGGLSLAAVYWPRHAQPVAPVDDHPAPQPATPITQKEVMERVWPIQNELLRILLPATGIKSSVAEEILKEIRRGAVPRHAERPYLSYIDAIESICIFRRWIMLWPKTREDLEELVSGIRGMAVQCCCVGDLVRGLGTTISNRRLERGPTQAPDQPIEYLAACRQLLATVPESEAPTLRALIRILGGNPLEEAS